MFNDTSRYLDDIFTIDNPEFEKHIPDIYPAELQLNKTNTSDKDTSFLDLNIKVIGSDIHTSVYDKRGGFGFPMRKRKRSDSVLWQKPLHQQKCQKGKVTTQTTSQKSSITLRLRTDLGRSVGVTTATPTDVVNLVYGPNLPTPCNSRVIKRTLRSVWLLVCCLYKEVYLHFFLNVCPFDYTADYGLCSAHTEANLGPRTDGVSNYNQSGRWGFEKARHINRSCIRTLSNFKCLFNLLHKIIKIKGTVEKVPRGIRGEKSSKDMASSRNLVSAIGAQASPKTEGRNQVSGRVSVPCWHATPVANAPWKPLMIW